MGTERLFISGTPRSGTTLLDKLLSSPETSRVHSQPLPLLFSAIKQRFLQQKGQTRDFPLNDMFLDNHYEQAPWQEFLAEHLISSDEFTLIHASMQGFSGQYTRKEDVSGFLDRYPPLPLASFIPAYLTWLEPGNWNLIGLKETWCEEYIPFLANNGFKCLLILRDPRDVITSLNHGEGRTFGGRPKPLLYNIRTWRKSVAVCLHMSAHPNFMSIRYEDLVTQPEDTMCRISAFLSLGDTIQAAATGGITDQKGRPWQSNSSHASSAEISSGSIGKYREHLPAPAKALIEALCQPELQVLDYPVNLPSDQARSVIADGALTEHLERPELASYLWSQQRSTEEVRRLELLYQGIYKPGYFLFEKAFTQLRLALLGPSTLA